MSTAPTVIPNIDADGWAQRLMRLYPRQWTSDEAKQLGGVLYSLFKAIGSQFVVIDEDLIYDFDACRIATALDSALDAVAADYFGAIVGYPQDIVRAPGEPDDSLRRRIYATLLLPMATRSALIALMTRLTGQVPRVMEPWNPIDTSVLDGFSYLDVDTPQNSGRLGDSSLRYAGFIESALPSFGNQGNNPIYCIDKGFCLDSPSAYLIPSQSTWWLSEQRLDQLVNKVKPVGTIAYRRYLAQALITYPIGASRSVPTGVSQFEIDLNPPFAGYIAIVATPNWNTGVSWQYVTNTKIFLNFSTAAPSGAMIDFVIAPIIYGGYGLLPIMPGSLTARLAIQPQVTGYTPIITPSWNTSLWITNLNSTEVDIEFSTPAPVGAQISYGFFPPAKSAVCAVEIGQPGAVASVSATGNYQAFAIPTWNTQIEIIKNIGSVLVEFSDPPASQQTLYVATFP